MRSDGQINPDRVGKYMLVGSANGQSTAIKIISVFEDLVGVAVMNPKVAMRSAKIRYDLTKTYSFYDTNEEADEALANYLEGKQ
jgi:hypothetical protein